MHLMLELPDELSAALAASGRDPSRAPLEAIALESLSRTQDFHRSTTQPSGLLDAYELDGFLKGHEVWLEYTAPDLEQDLQTHRRPDL